MLRCPPFPPLAISLALLAGPSLVTLAQTSDPAPLRIAGVVSDSVTGRPIGHALVASFDRRLATLTDDEGRFSFDLRAPDANAPASGAGLVQLHAQKPGYIAPEEFAVVSVAPLANGQSGSTGFAFGGSQPVEQPPGAVLLRLTPAAVVTGTVSADTTDAARDVPIILLKHQVIEGEPTWVELNRTSTNSAGAFRFAGLEAGDYTVMSGEWNGDNPLPSIPSQISRQYPPVFAGDTPQLTSGAVLHLEPGDTTPVDLHLRAATYYPVVIPYGEGGGRLGVDVSAVDSVAEFSLGVAAREHIVTGALPDGDYTVRLFSGRVRGPRSGNEYAIVPLHIQGAPVRTAPVTLLAPGSILVRVHRQFTQQHDGNSYFNVVLRPTDARRSFPGVGSQPAGRDEFPIENVLPGSYLVSVQCSTGYASAVTSGGADLLREPLVVGPNGSADPIEITVRDDSGTVSGSVAAANGTPPARSYLYLVPMDGTGHFAQAFAGSSHTFTLQNVPPGNYRLLASISPRRQIAWRDPSALETLNGQGVSITVAPGATVQQDVPLEGR